MATKYKGKLNVDTSIVDYLKSVGKDSSKEARKKLAEQLGITDYAFKDYQNTQMLDMLKSGANTPKSATTPEVAKPKATTPTAPQAPKAVEPTKTLQTPQAPVQDTAPVEEIKPQSYTYQGQAPAQYESPYSAQIETILNNIINRKPFSYDAGADPIYNQYKDMYTKQGNLAMRDTIGNAASLTGGYGSSYAQSVGQQAYDSYLGQLNNVIPELYQAAYGRYQTEGNNMLNNLSALQGLEQQSYGKHRDAVGDYQADRAFDYNQYIDAIAQDNWNRQFEHGVSQDALAQENWNKQFEHGVSQDALAQENWNKQFSHNVSQDELSQQNFLKEFAYRQAQDTLAQSNWNKQFNYNKQQDSLKAQSSSSSSNSTSKESAERINKYAKYVNDMLNATVVDELGIASSKYTIDDVWDYLMKTSLTDDEIAVIIDGNYELMRYAENKKGKGVTSSGRTYSYGGRKLN